MQQSAELSTGGLPPLRAASHAGVPQQPANSSSVCSTRNAAEDLQEQRKKPHPEGGGHRHKSIPGQWCNSPNRSRFTTNNQPSHRHYEVAHIRIFGSLTQRPSMRLDGQATALLFVSIWSNHGIKTVVKNRQNKASNRQKHAKTPINIFVRYIHNNVTLSTGQHDVSETRKYIQSHQKWSKIRIDEAENERHEHNADIT